ncbi:hypothetical protein [Cerasicoccus frondis]|uniref:hypothetical protein n=1 Tax=Cerasicoccus frondis TaxID=490090 RepID=UPI002852A6D2|nr:hypothetical protein [Cerasicoccus frondis]
MKKSFLTLAAVLTLALASTLLGKVTINQPGDSPTSPSAAAAVEIVPTRVSWEYDTYEGGRPLSESQLNGYGQKGWELVGFTAVGYDPTTSAGARYYYVFKRPK